MEDRECNCGYNPFNSMDQCYCDYVPVQKIRTVTPLPEEERETDSEDLPAEDDNVIPDGMSLIAWLAGMDLLTPG